MRPTTRERAADNIVHVVGVMLGLTAVLSLLVAACWHLPLPSTASVVVYGAGLLSMLGFSAAYHMLPVPAWKDRLRRLDHAAIFVKIAGTYTPFAAIKIGGTAGWALLTTVWTVAMLGAAGKLVLASTWDRLAVPLYLLLGWTGVLMVAPLAQSVTNIVLVLLTLGGILYTAGVVFHLWRSLPYQNAIWHVFVLAGTACHFGAVTGALFS